MARLRKLFETKIKFPENYDGTFQKINKKGGEKICHVGKIELDGPGGPKPERCSMKNSMYAVAIHLLCWSSKSLQILQKILL